MVVVRRRLGIRKRDSAFLFARIGYVRTAVSCNRQPDIGPRSNGMIVGVANVRVPVAQELLLPHATGVCETINKT